MISDDIPESNDVLESKPEDNAGEAPKQKKSWVRRYLAIPTLVGFGLMFYLIFFGEHSARQKMAYQVVIDSLNECLQAQQDTLAYYRDLNRRLSTDPVLMEQVVREQYNMNRPNEDVYLIK